LVIGALSPLFAATAEQIGSGRLSLEPTARHEKPPYTAGQMARKIAAEAADQINHRIYEGNAPQTGSTTALSAERLRDCLAGGWACPGAVGWRELHIHHNRTSVRISRIKSRLYQNRLRANFELGNDSHAVQSCKQENVLARPRWLHHCLCACA
jgi:hypothetical protein